ncbi:MAG: hypothetical protein ACI8Y4_004287 [Candidatus Poriferisodalaceae bacterium]|jgi:hypothetical protein
MTASAFTPKLTYRSGSTPTPSSRGHRASAEQEEKTVAESHERYVKSFEKDKGPSGKQT